MGTLRILIGTLVLFISFSLSAQSNWNWGKDEAQAKKEWKSFNQALVNKDWAGSKPHLEWLLFYAPKLNEELYDKGQLVYRLLSLKAPSEEKKEEYKQKVNELSILKSDYFGQDQHFFVVNENVTASNESEKEEESFSVNESEEQEENDEQSETTPVEVKEETTVTAENNSAEDKEETTAQSENDSEEDIEVAIGTVDLSIQLEDDNSVHITAEEKAQFDGGPEAFGKFLRKNLSYPKEAVKTKTQGKVYVSFIVEKDGSLSELNVLKGLGHGCDAETIRVMSKSPNWIPARNKGITVRQQVTIPIVFRME
ncbi:energy transducer TonB [Mangrovivirga sp. M17]|uniref:Energy transducer TonB n=1 Tax=Mangrovivirga halotolerans TaxID=2993936 RepID=A0ABT3RL75_9BACT|nr:energy transducer TonB [Mangrovivirga halotolerans]MCX2742305.1 energy transducer TonB [Mangrovivirga halotolerans]